MKNKNGKSRTNHSEKYFLKSIPPNYYSILKTFVLIFSSHHCVQFITFQNFCSSKNKKASPPLTCFLSECSKFHKLSILKKREKRKKEIYISSNIHFTQQSLKPRQTFTVVEHYNRKKGRIHVYLLNLCYAYSSGAYLFVR